MKLLAAACIVVTFWVTGCSSSLPFDASQNKAEAIIHQCQTEIERRTEKKLSHEADRAYVYESASESYYTMQFSHGAVGTFGPRGADQGTVWSCSVDHGEIKFLGNLSSPPLIDKEYEVPDYNQGDNVNEYLYLRFGDGFKFIAVQKFDENNIDKYNPNFFN